MTTDEKATEFADGLRAMAAMIEANPETLDALSYPLRYMNAPNVGTREQMATLIRTAMRAGATISKRQQGDYAGADISFGPVKFYAYTPREEVCERVVTGTREVTREVPDPAIVAAAPLVKVTETVEDVEWRCMPLMDGGNSEDVLPDVETLVMHDANMIVNASLSGTEAGA